MIAFDNINKAIGKQLFQLITWGVLFRNDSNDVSPHMSMDRKNVFFYKRQDHKLELSERKEDPIRCIMGKGVIC